MDYDSIAIFSTVFVAIRAIAIVVGVVLVAVRATGRRRVLGVVGLLIMVLGTIVGYGLNASLPMISNTLGQSTAPVYIVIFAINLLFDLVALALIVAALCARDQSASTVPGPYPR